MVLKFLIADRIVNHYRLSALHQTKLPVKNIMKQFFLCNKNLLVMTAKQYEKVSR